MKKLYIIILVTFIIFNNIASGQPTITAFAPVNGNVGTAVTINGTNFSTISANNIVFFGATKATVNSATTTSLNVTVPIGATNQYISVTDLTVGLTANSLQQFIVTFPYCTGIVSNSFAPKVNFATGFSPNGIAIGDLDGDGKTDLSVANKNSNTISVFKNTSLSGTVSYSPKADFTTGTKPYGIAISDLDGDGKLDLVVTNYSSNTVSIFKNTSTIGTISFAPKVDLTTETGPHGIIIGDLNQDGKPDLSVGNESSNTISVFKNTSTSGNISFALKVDFATGSDPWGISLGDLDGDGKPDLAVTNVFNCGNTCNTVSVFRNTSSGGNILFATKIDFASGVNPAGVAITDIDGDGKSDLAVANSGSNSLSLFKNTSSIGTISFSAKVDFTAGSNPLNISFGDLNGDGKVDLAATNSSANTISIFKNTSISGTISLAPKVDYSMGSGANPVDLFISDLDGDGISDLGITNGSANTLSTIRNVGALPPTMTSTNTSTIISGNPLTIPLTSSFSSTYTWIAADNANTTGESVTSQTTDTLSNTIFNNFTSDQTVNYTVTPTSTIGSCIGAPQTISVTVKLGAPTFTPQSGPIGTTVVITGTNFDATPANNIVFFGAVRANVSTASTTLLSVTVPAGATYQNISVTNLATSLTVYTAKPFIVTFPCGGDIDTSSFAPQVGFTSGHEPYDIAVGDFEGDGKLDVIVVNSSSIANSVSVFKNTSVIGTISFAPKINYATSLNPRHISVADLDGDGKLDFAVTTVTTGKVSTFKNTSSGGIISFSQKVDFTTGPLPYGLAISDLNADGKPDMAITYDQNTMSILQNTSTNGIISFAPKVDYPTIANSNPLGIAIDNLDGDGWPDLAVTNVDVAKVSIFKNMSTGGNISLAPKVDYISGSSPWNISIGDLDADGKPDLVFSNDNDSMISIQKNTSTNGIISFAPKINFATAKCYRSVSIGDLDGDGKPEVIGSNTSCYGGGNTISILKNTSTVGTISFASKKVFILGGGPGSLAIGDLDGDGKSDLAATEYSSNGKFWVLRNKVSIAQPIIMDQAICGAGIVTLNASGAGMGVNYKWYDSLSNGTLLQTNGSSYTTPLISSTTTYYVTKYDTITLCESSPRKAVTITVNSKPSTPVITQSDVVLYSSATIGNQWCINGVAISGATNQNYRACQTGIYTVVVIVNGCVSDTSNSIVSNQMPLSQPLSTNVTICGAQAVILNASGSALGENYKWYNSLSFGTLLQTNDSSYTTPIISATTTYYVTKYDTATLCESTPRTTITITFIPKPPTPNISQSGVILSSNATVGNQWFINGIAIGGASSQNYTAYQSGIYEVVVTINGCASDTSAPFNFSTTGINYTEQQQIVISPNPFTSQTTVTFNQEQKNIIIKITDALGNEVRIISFTGKQCMIDKGALNKGIYFLQINDQNKNRVNRKIIVQ